MKRLILSLIDLLHLILKPWIPIQTFRYAVCGGSNLILDIILYYIFFHFIFQKQNFNLHIVTLSSHVASLVFVYPITFITGFLLNKYISFQGSILETKTQFYRYMIVSIGGIIASYLALKLFVDVMGFYPTPSRILTITLSIVSSYFLQLKYSFR